MPATKLVPRDATAIDPAPYEADFYAWTRDQACALRERRLSALDLENLAEEIWDVGNAVFSELRSHFRVILIHMLKWDAQPERRSRSWSNSIKSHRVEIEDLVQLNSSMRGRQAEAMAAAFRTARLKASTEMRRDEHELPTICPYTLDEVLTRAFPWPQR